MSDIDKSTNPVVSAQPVQSSYIVTPGTIAAAPIQTTGHLPTTAQNVVPHGGSATGIVVTRPPANRWKDGICDWPNNMYPSCYCTCCCCYGMWLVAQMAKKTNYTSFECPVFTYITLWFIFFIITLITGSGVWVVLFPMFFVLFFAIALRLHIVRQDNITECGSFAECCTGFWCFYCSITQMARHLYGYTKVLDGDGDPDRGDNYAPVSQV
mmetsp:Transcript_24508/g.40861  ORF Transcript_24508/g.40861 Transcript_24508/m.40861 type:complete len:211 (-) Transcript_24508:424-1056(-)|eukprot:CAMPEP_0174953814 /NCGR_PEP_ID=MMETSP0004_2-20121128/69_1 /TAXON_ID=420556 /ORGANISM="Ochromonas sp., Strain CCMP1393" /LENGTH=210 /DNA_ID=CAMNT_0016201541 /DNA_START=113 /DNA_END=745 /DNA_ORIENTATION=+